MRITPMLVAVLITPLFAQAAERRGIDAAAAASIDRAVLAAVELRLTPGAVVVAGRSDGVLYQKAFGRLTYDPGSAAVTPDTVYDMASLTKTVATATSVMVLVEQKKLAVVDPVGKHLPGMSVPDKKDVTIEHCLLHRAGFVADNPIGDYSGTPDAAMAAIYAGKLKTKPGAAFEYSDVGFIVLGELVKNVGGAPLDAFARQHVFDPLGMTGTAFNPPIAWQARIAPTEFRQGGKPTVGTVHDPRAARLGGVAGHAGLFSTGPDVARYCRMILGKGQLDGKRVLGEATVAEMLESRCMPDGKNCRGYGWDVDTKFSPANRGERFERGSTMGHTGYTGTSLWLDPVNDAFIVILTNRVHPDDDATIAPLRKRVATIAAEAMLGPKGK
jgi:serine-type D-Ala-D-Ala carboxypeptidase